MQTGSAINNKMSHICCFCWLNKCSVDETLNPQLIFKGVVPAPSRVHRGTSAQVRQ